MTPPVWTFACPDWRERIREGRSLMPDLPLFEAEADEAAAFFDTLRLPDVPGKPFLGGPDFAAGDWFREIVRALFGSRDPETNIRHVPELFLMVGKGNSKTTYSAALMLVALLMNIRPQALFLLVAPSQSTADIAYAAAKGMVEADPELTNRFWCRDLQSGKEIIDRTNGATLKIATFSLEILTGPKPVGVLLDEIHLLAKDKNAVKIIRQIRGGLQKNTEGFLLIITTQSDDEPIGAFRDELKTARAIRDGEHGGRMLPILYEFPEDIASDREKWSDPAVWPMVMPNLGRSLRLEALIGDWEAETRKGEHAIVVWASQHLNIQVGLGIGVHAWRAGTAFWKKSVDRTLTLDELIKRSHVIVVGFDGGGMDDLLGLAVLGRCATTKRWLLWTKAWAHKFVLEEREEIAAKLTDLEADGDLILVDDPRIAVKQAVDVIVKLDASGKLGDKEAVGVDAIGSPSLANEIESRKFDMTRVVSVQQGFKLNGAIKAVETQLASGELVHADRPLMSWCVGNAKAELKGNATTISKQAAGTAKIDPLMALFDAVVVMSMNPEPRRVSGRGLRVL